MKKIAMVILGLFLACGSVFSDEVKDLIEGTPKVDLSQETITYDNAKIRNEIYNGKFNDMTATITITYIPMVDEARFFYNTMSVNYDKGQAMEIIRSALEYFTLQKHYRNFHYIDRDRERCYAGNRGFSMTQYSQHVGFTR